MSFESKPCLPNHSSAGRGKHETKEPRLGLVRFAPKGKEGEVLIGQPIDSNIDVGKAVRNGEEVQVKVFSGDSALSPGSLTDRTETIARILSPLAASEVGSIRCIGLNVGWRPWFLRDPC